MNSGVIRPRPCGCTIHVVDTSNPNCGTLDNPLTVRPCALHTDTPEQLPRGTVRDLAIICPHCGYDGLDPDIPHVLATEVTAYYRLGPQRLEDGVWPLETDVVNNYYDGTDVRILCDCGESFLPPEDFEGEITL